MSPLQFSKEKDFRKWQERMDKLKQKPGSKKKAKAAKKVKK